MVDCRGVVCCCGCGHRRRVPCGIGRGGVGTDRAGAGVAWTPATGLVCQWRPVCDGAGTDVMAGDVRCPGILVPRRG